MKKITLLLLLLVSTTLIFAQENHKKCISTKLVEEELKKLASETKQDYSVCSDVTNAQSVEESLKEIGNDKISGFAYCVGSIVLKSFQNDRHKFYPML